jgi:hypothetical protein
MSKRLAERLDWNRMLGFEQVADDREALRAAGSARLGAKVGDKPGVKVITRGDRISAKIGSKFGLKS